MNVVQLKNLVVHRLSQPMNGVLPKSLSVHRLSQLMNGVLPKSLVVHRLSQLTNGVQARTIRDGEPRTATSTFTQLLSSEFYSRLAYFFVFCFVFETIGFEFNWLDTLRRYIYIYRRSLLVW